MALKDDNGSKASNGHEANLRSQIEGMISKFISEMTSKGSSRPLISPMLEDGQSLDLVSLFLVVRQMGGFEVVSIDGLWDFVAIQLGFDGSASAAVEQIYAKFLFHLEKSLKGSLRDTKSENGEVNRCPWSLPVDLETEFRGLLANAVDKKKSDHRKSDNMNCNDDKERAVKDDRDHSLSDMLSWLAGVAKCPHDPSIGKIPGPSKRKKNEGNVFWREAIRVREALFRRIASDLDPESAMEGNQNIRSLFGDVSQGSTKRLRRRNSRPECPLQPVAKKQRKEKAADFPKSRKKGTRARCVPVSDKHQAEVPQWTGPVVSNSDLKWSGKREWPLESRNSGSSIGIKDIGKGRPDSCACSLPGSVECVRFHIAETSLNLKLELGSAFYKWGFNQMGEEVSLRWTEEEEKLFKDLYSSDSHFFWENTSMYFPHKTRAEVVSYFFNVFTLCRRRYQNKGNHNDIDSDDESGFGSVGHSYGYKATTTPGASILNCLQNNQCTDWPENEIV